MNNWTPEPWPVYVNLFPENVSVDKMSRILQTNYKRARACVNALAGLNPKAIPQVVKALENCLKDMEATRASGDCGNWEWEWEEGDVYTNAKQALEELRGKK